MGSMEEAIQGLIDLYNRDLRTTTCLCPSLSPPSSLQHQVTPSSIPENRHQVPPFSIPENSHFKTSWNDLKRPVILFFKDKSIDLLCKKLNLIHPAHLGEKGVPASGS